MTPRFKQIIVFSLVACFILVSGPIASAQTVMDPVSFNNSSSDDNSTEEAVLVGALIVVVGILVWLGIKEDFGRWGKAGVPEGIALYDEGSSEGWGLYPGDQGEVGLGMRF